MDSDSSSSSSSSLPNFQRKLSKSRKSPLTPLLCILILFIANIPTNTSLVQSPTTTSNSIAEISYTQHCNEVVPESPNSFPFSYSTSTSQFLLFRTGFFSGGDRIFNQTSTDSPKSLTFIPLHSEKTASDGIFKVQATLNLRNPAMYPVFSNTTHRLLRQIRFRGPRRLPWRPVARFLLDGYWSESSGKLCMVGSFSTYVDPGKRNRFNAVLKLNYPINSSIYGSLIGGTLESLSNDKDDSNYFEPISIMGFKYSNHEYTFIEKENGSGCLSGYDGGENLSRNKTNRFVCPFPRGQTFSYSLEYGRHCGSGNCNPFGGSIRYLPNSMFYRGIWCWEGRKLQILLSFPNSSYTGYEFPFDPNTTLIAEAEWDEKENRLCGVACRILNVTESWANASVGDCSIGLSLIFPPVVSLRNRSTIVGEIQSRKHVNDSGYFGKIGFKSSQERSIDVQGLKYEYTEIENARKHCAKRKIRSKGKTYPNGYSLDMRFDMSISNSTGKVATGYSTPYFVGDQLYLQRYYGHSFVLPVPAHRKSLLLLPLPLFLVMMPSILPNSLFLQQTLDPKSGFPMKFNVMHFPSLVDQSIGLNTCTFDVPVILWNTNIIEQEHERVQTFWMVGEEVENPPILLYVRLSLSLPAYISEGSDPREMAIVESILDIPIQDPPEEDFCRDLQDQVGLLRGTQCG